MRHPYNVYLTNESDAAGNVVYWAEYREVPWQAPGATKDEALAKLGLYANAYFEECQKQGIAPKPFISHALVFDWCYSLTAKNTDERRNEDGKTKEEKYD